MAALDGLSILVPESREGDLFGGMLEAEGATVLRCPLVRILDLDNSADAQAWIEMLIAGALQDVIWLTGEGVRRLVTMAARIGRDRAFIEALGRVRHITRGPKPIAALRALGLGTNLAAPKPTSEGVAEALMDADIEGRRIGVQLYPGEGAALLLDKLQARGARVFAVTPYRYASDADNSQVVGAIRALAEGHIGLVAFTATPQIERLFEVAKDKGLEQELRQGLARTPIAAVGPVVEETLHAYGVASAIQPDASFHLKPLVRAIITWRTVS